MSFDKLLIGIACLFAALVASLSGCSQAYPPYPSMPYPTRVIRDRQGQEWRVFATPMGPMLQPIRVQSQPGHQVPAVAPPESVPTGTQAIRYEVKPSTVEAGAKPKAEHRTPVSEAELRYTCDQPDAVAHVACRSYAASHDAISVLNKLRLERIEAARRSAAAATTQAASHPRRYPRTMHGSANEFGVECSRGWKRRYLVAITNQRSAQVAAALDRRVIVDDSGNPVVVGYGSDIYTCVSQRELGFNHQVVHAIYEPSGDDRRWKPVADTAISHQVFLQARDGQPNFVFLVSR